MTIERWPNEAEMIAQLYGGAWSNPTDWAARCRPEGCIVCSSGRPYGILTESDHVWVTTDPEVALFGYVCVISKIHAVEPFDLPRDNQVSFWMDTMAVARAITSVLSPIKMNYEIHGNTLPHLHMHLLPRQAEDAFVGRPIDLKEFHHRYTDHDIANLRTAIAAVIGRTGSAD